jgi:hypothetical protein
VRRWMGRTTVLLLLLTALGASAACGRYGPPVRSEQYKLEDQERERARAERLKNTSPQERNEPLPAAP